MLPFPKLKAINNDNEEKQVVIWILHSHLHAGWGTPFVSTQNEYPNRRKRYDVPLYNIRPISASDGGTGDVAYLCNVQHFREKQCSYLFDQHTTIWKRRSLFAFKQKSPVVEMSRKRIPLPSHFLSAG